jgi:hypothetical protein
MLNILAESFRVATRTDLWHAPAPDELERRRVADRAADRWFWNGRRWGPPAGR